MNFFRAYDKVDIFEHVKILAPIPPPTNDWLWSNASHIYIQLSGWDDAGCDIANWDVEYKLLSASDWLRADNKAVRIPINISN